MPQATEITELKDNGLDPLFDDLIKTYFFPGNAVTLLEFQKKIERYIDSRIELKLNGKSQ